MPFNDPRVLAVDSDPLARFFMARCLLRGFDPVQEGKTATDDEAIQWYLSTRVLEDPHAMDHVDYARAVGTSVWRTCLKYDTHPNKETANV